MARYILIDNHSGFIWGDTADVGGETLRLGDTDEDIIAACRAVDDEIGGEIDRDYEVVSAAALNGHAGYFVYRVDVRGSEQVTVVTDGQDREMIDAVERDCELVAAVRFSQHVKDDAR